MKTKRFLLSILLLLVMSFNIVPCYATSEGTAEPEFPEFTEEVTITWWNWLSVPEKVVESFNEVYPNITVEFPLVGSGADLYSKWQTVMQAGSGAPDVMQVEYQYLPQFIDAGYLVDITEYVGQYEDFFVPWTWSQCVRDGKVYAMPQDRGPLAFLYRPDIFEEYGLTVPTTYDQMAEEAAKLHEANPDMYYTHFPTNDPGKVIGFIWQAGGRPFHFDSAANQWQVSINDDASKSVMTYWGDLIDNGLVKASPDFTPEFNAEIGDGLYASLIAPAWFFPNYGAPYTTEETGYWNVAPIPQWDPSNPSNGNWGGSTYGVTTQSKNPEAAALFVAWVSASKEIAELDIAEDGRSLVPASIFWEELDGFNNPDPIYSNQSDVNQIYLDASELVDNTFEWSPWTDFVFNSYNEEITKASEGQIPWDQLLDNVQNNTVAFAESMGYSVVSSSGNSGSSPQETDPGSSPSNEASETAPVSSSASSGSQEGGMNPLVIGIIIAVVVIVIILLIVRRVRSK